MIHNLLRRSWGLRLIIWNGARESETISCSLRWINVTPLCFYEASITSLQGEKEGEGDGASHQFTSPAGTSLQTAFFWTRWSWCAEVWTVAAGGRGKSVNLTDHGSRVGGISKELTVVPGTRIWSTALWLWSRGRKLSEVRFHWRQKKKKKESVTGKESRWLTFSLLKIHLKYAYSCCFVWVVFICCQLRRPHSSRRRQTCFSTTETHVEKWLSCPPPRHWR